MRANRLLHSAKPRLIEPSDQSAAKRQIMVIKAKCTHILSAQILCSYDRLLLSLYVQVKNLVKSVHFFQIQHNFTCS